MNTNNGSFNVVVSRTGATCPVGEVVGNKNRDQGKIPVLSCEGACIRGEIARLAAHLVAKEEPYRRGCHGELLTVPGSALAQWMTASEKIVLIDGCFLHCHGRMLENLIGKERLAQFDALSYYKQYTEHFDIDAVPEAERKAAARLVADSVLAELRQTSSHGCGSTVAEGCT
jgi:uncharacterized metal-binding protein